MSPTAKEESEKAKTDCKNIMEMIAEIIDKQTVSNEKGGIHWGHVGDILRTKTQLKETLASFLYTPEGTEDDVNKSIEAELEKMRK